MEFTEGFGPGILFICLHAFVDHESTRVTEFHSQLFFIWVSEIKESRTDPWEVKRSAFP